MNDLKKNIREKIKIALEIIDDIDNNFKSDAFKIVLAYLIQHSNQLKKTQNVLNKENSLTLSELISEVKPNTYTDTALIISYFLFTFQNITIFNIDNIKDGFDSVRKVKPKNMTDILNNLIKRGFLRESSDIDGKKGFEITKKGIRLVEDILSNVN